MRNNQPTDNKTNQRIALTVSLLLLAVYLTTSVLQFHSIDGVALFSVARSLAGHGAADSDGLFWVMDPMGRGSVVAQGQDGHMYSVKDVGLSILAVPFVWLAGLADFSPMRTALLISPLATAITAGLLYLLILEWGYSRRAGLLGAFLFGLGSMAWPYAETFYTQPLSALGLLLALYGSWHAYQRHSWPLALLGGLGLGLSGANAMSTWISGPFYLLYLVRWADLPRHSRQGVLRRALPLVLAFGLGAGLILAGQLAYNLFRFGAPLDSGFNQLRPNSFSLANIPVAMIGMLASSSRGAIWYAPFVLLLPFGWKAAAEDGRLRFAWLVLGQVSSTLLVYTLYEEWWGGLAWGPRFLVSLMPALVLLLVPWLEKVSRPGARPWASWATGGLFLFSALVQLLAAIVGEIPRESELFSLYKALPFPHTFPATAPLFTNLEWLPQVRLAAAFPVPDWDMLWLAGGEPDVWLLAAQAGAILLGILVLRNRARSGWGTAVLGIATSGLIIMILLRFPAAPETAPGLSPLAAAINEQAGPGECVLTLLPSRYQHWLDGYPGPLPDVGMMFEDPLSPRSEAMLNRMEGWCRRVWLVTEETLAGNPANGVERWLAGRGFAGPERWFEDLRLIPYSFADGLEETRPVGQPFDNGRITLAAAAVEPAGGQQPAWINVWLQWTATGPVPENHTIFAHLLDEAGTLVAQHDGQPAAGYAPTSTWADGQPIDDRHQLLLPPTMPAGQYRLVAGLYNWQTNERLPLAGSLEDVVLLDVLILGDD